MLPLKALAIRRAGTPSKCLLSKTCVRTKSDARRVGKVCLARVARSKRSTILSKDGRCSMSSRMVQNKIGVRGHSLRAGSAGTRKDTALGSTTFTVVSLGRGPILMRKGLCGGGRAIGVVRAKVSNVTAASASLLPCNGCGLRRAGTPRNCLASNTGTVRFSVARGKGVVSLASRDRSVCGRVGHKSLRKIGVKSNARGELTGMPFGVADGAANRDRVMIASGGNRFSAISS